MYLRKSELIAVPDAPSRDKPTGCACEPQDTPAAPPFEPTPFQPVSPFPGLTSLPAMDCTSAPQFALMVDACANNAVFHPAMAFFTRPDSSANVGARNDCPHAPLIVKPISSDTVQLNATFGLLVPPTSLYWS